MRAGLLRGQAVSFIALVALALAGPLVPTAGAQRSAKHKAKAAQPVACLKQAKLVDISKSNSSTWEGHAPGSDPNDHNWTVWVDGPYGSHAAAQQSAQSLQDVEYAVAAGPWVVQTTVRSHIRSTVDQVAQCLEHPAKAKHKRSKHKPSKKKP